MAKEDRVPLGTARVSEQSAHEPFPLTPYFQLEPSVAVDQLEIAAIGGDQARSVGARCEGNQYVEVKSAPPMRRQPVSGANLSEQPA